MPSPRLVTARPAWPPFKLTVPSVVFVVRSVNVIEPAGVSVLGAFGVTVAVNVTDCPKPVGSSDWLRAVVVVPCLRSHPRRSFF